MIKVKYSDEKYLCKYDLDMKLFDNLGIDIIDLWPTRNIFMLDSKQGKKVLKIIEYPEERLNFICKVIDYIKRNYDNILIINKLPNDKMYLEWNGDKYILLDVIEGIECSVTNPLDLEIATTGIALMHNGSKGIMDVLSEEELKRNSNLFKLPNYFEDNKEELLKFKSQVNDYKYKNEFDKLFIKEVDYHITQIDKCKELINNSKYIDMCKDEKYIALCHNDLAYHNLLIKDGIANFIDFDYCEIDLRVKDIWNFIIKSIKKFGFSIEMCDLIIENYNKVYKLSKEEYELLYIYLRFPSDFYTISREYYLKLKDWNYDAYLSKFENKLEYSEEKEILLQYFKEKYIK